MSPLRGCICNYRRCFDALIDFCISLFSVGLHPRRNSNITSVVSSYIIEKPSTAMQTFFLVKPIPSTVSKKHQKKTKKNLEKVKKSPYLCTRKWEKHLRLKTSASSFKTVENDQIFNPKLTIKIWLESEKLLNFALAFDTNNHTRQNKIRTLTN